MRQSILFTKTSKEPPKDEQSINAQLLERAGYIAKLSAGVATYLPLGLRVLRKIENIIREEMNTVGGQEVFMPALQPKSLWEKTDRWEGLKDVMYQFDDPLGKSAGLAITHEEVITDIVRRFVHSYKDLPFSVYQIQTKFRHELRPKSGLVRGREFSMKDLYSFHVSEDDLTPFYERMKEAYMNVFKRVGLDALLVEASGGAFMDGHSHEFQVLCDSGEDHILHNASGSFAQNREIATVKSGDPSPNSDGTIQESRGIEVGNIFRLGTRFSDAIGARFLDKDGKSHPIVMASYGIGSSRVMGTIVEVSHDVNGIIWPQNVAPYLLHLVRLGVSEPVAKAADEIYDTCIRKGIEVLYDDRSASPGEKLKDADLIGLPHRCIVSERTKANVEYRRRNADTTEQCRWSEVERRLISP